MKKLLFTLSLSIFTIGSTVSAADLPSSTEVSFEVLNVAKNNEDAQQNTVKPGDTLRYEYKVSSDFEDVSAYVAEIELGNLLEKVDLIDVGSATVVDNKLVFPPFSHAAPCEKVFTFFVRIKPCTDDFNLTTSVNGKTTKVTTACKTVKLNQSGGHYSWWMYALLFGFVAFFFGSLSRKALTK